MAKTKEVLDWYGNPIDGYAGISAGSRHFFMGETDDDGKKYMRIYTAGGVPGDRLALEGCYLCITDESGKVLYDSRREPPPDAVLKPNETTAIEPRQQRGLVIAALSKIKRYEDEWTVPSQSNNGKYKVCLGPDKTNLHLPGL
jgi:hypothetical protein